MKKTIKRVNSRHTGSTEIWRFGSQKRHTTQSGDKRFSYIYNKSLSSSALLLNKKAWFKYVMEALYVELLFVILQSAPQIKVLS